MTTSDTSNVGNTAFSAGNDRPLAAQMRISPSLLGEIRVNQTTDGQQHLPLSSTQTGNLYKDRFDTNLFWYLPSYALADDPDAAFHFAATQTGTDTNGNAFNRATITLGLKKSVPADVQAAQTQNPTATFQEIAFSQFNVTLSTTFIDTTGASQQNTYYGTISSQDEHLLQLTFDTILGPAVIVAYNNIARDGNAQLVLTALYNVWVLHYYPRSTGGGSSIWPQRQSGQSHERLEEFHLAPGIMSSITASESTSTIHPIEAVAPVEPGAVVHPIAPVEATEVVHPVGAMESSAVVHPIASIEPTAIHFTTEPILNRFPGMPRPPIEGWGPVSGLLTPVYSQNMVPLEVTLPPGLKYASGGYKQDFTVTDGANTRPIISVDDLKNYNVRQSEYSEFLAFGDISSKYPSFSKLYMGVLSQTIVVVPSHYGIVRSSAGCAAVCQALVDSSPSSTSGSRFQFSFLLGPVISPIDLLQLAQDISTYPGLKNYKLQLPSQIDTGVVASLVTSFKSSCTYTPGTLPHTFMLSVAMQDDATGLPSVASANLFIKQLATSVIPFLSGSFGIKLDDYYTPAVEASAVLNFSMTGSTDELSFTVDEANHVITLTNHCSLDVSLSRYAFYSASNLTVVPFQQLLASTSSVSLPLPTNYADPTFMVVVDATLALPTPLTKLELGRYLAFETQDVQSVQYDLGINASNIDFKTRGISQIVAQIRFTDPSLANIAIAPFTLSADLLATSTRVVIPIEYAISSLAATIECTVQFVNPQQAQISFTLTNDFIDYAIFVLLNTSLPRSLA